MPRTQSQAGQALVESAIVIPLLMLVFLCALQIMMIAHTRIMLEYAAFSAARAGVVFNGNNNAMRNAALLALVPTFPTRMEPGTAHTKTPLQRFLQTWLWMKAWAEIGGAIDSGTATIENFLTDLTGGRVSFGGIFPSLSVVSVDILNPGPNDFPDGKEIDFDLGARLEGGTPDDAENLRKTQLTIRVTYLYPLRVPLAERFVWYIYMLGAFVNQKLMAPDWRQWWKLEGTGGADVEAIIDKAEFATGLPLPTFPNGWQAYVADQGMFQILKRVPGETGLYLMPLEALHTMPMESNLFKRYLNQR